MWCSRCAARRRPALLMYRSLIGTPYGGHLATSTKNLYDTGMPIPYEYSRHRFRSLLLFCIVPFSAVERTFFGHGYIRRVDLRHGHRLWSKRRPRSLFRLPAAPKLPRVERFGLVFLDIRFVKLRISPTAKTRVTVVNCVTGCWTF